MGGVVTVLILAIGLLNGVRLLSMRGGLQYDWAALAVAYFGASFLGGLLVGVLQPLGRRKVGAAALGILVGAVFGVSLHYAERPIASWGAKQVVVVAILALALGAPLGISFREIFLDKDAREPSSRHRAA